MRELARRAYRCAQSRGEVSKPTLGFFIARDAYFGKHGLSLRLQGLEPGFNDQADVRGIGSSAVGIAADELLLERGIATIVEFS